MASARVLRAFYDRVAGTTRSAGDAFEASDARMSEIEAALPGYVERVATDEPLGKMTNKQLAELCEERGVTVPKGANKARLLELLEG